MGKIVWPLEGVYGKNFRTTSSFGWRTHPIQKTRKHHNGEDLVGQQWVRSMAAGTVITARASKSKKNNGEPGGFGYFVTVRHMIAGEYYTSLYAHLKKGTFQVKEGDKVQAGQLLGEMGTSGASTGVHLHWEIWKGKTHGWTADGRGFADPIAFVEAHGAASAVAESIGKPSIDKEELKKYAAPATKPKYTDAMSLGDADRGEDVAYLQKFLGITVDGIFGPKTHAAVVAFQRKHKNIIADGVVGPITWELVNIDKKPVKATPAKKPAPAKKPVAQRATPKVSMRKPALSGWLKVGSRGEDVKYIQQYLGIQADGIFGPQTNKAVKAFQKTQKLKVDGIVGTVTYGRMK